MEDAANLFRRVAKHVKFCQKPNLVNEIIVFQ